MGEIAQDKEEKKTPPQGEVWRGLTLRRLSCVSGNRMALIVDLLLAVDHLRGGDHIVVHLEGTQVLLTSFLTLSLCHHAIFFWYNNS